MKEISKIAKSFTCECGIVNKFEFETDFDVHDIRMAVKCQSCGRERTIELMNFFRKHPTIIQPIAGFGEQNQSVSIFDAPIPQENRFLTNIAASQDQQNQRISSADFFEAMPVGIAQENAQNPMDMFDQNSAASNPLDNPDQEQKQPNSIYAGLLDLAQIQDDEIYEPFKEENETVGNQIGRIQNEKQKQREDEETFSALFGNL